MLRLQGGDEQLLVPRRALPAKPTSHLHIGAGGERCGSEPYHV